MQWTMNENSLFAVLLRSRWWLSFALAIGFSAAGVTLLPAPYTAAGYLMGVPFAVIGCIAAWRQLRAPSNARIQRAVTAAQAMSAPEFKRALADGLRRDGYTVDEAAGKGFDFSATKEYRRAVVACKRFKVARTGVEPLRELLAARDAAEAQDAIYVALGEVTDTAAAFAAKHTIRIVGGAELARLSRAKR
jgi:restriction system protein